MKKIPYGIADFKVIQDEGYYYVDKTMYIPLFEKAGKFLFFIRPRRFGKTLMLNVLESYYDRAWESEFDALFKDTYIRTHPTEEKHKYLVLKFNFSQIHSDPEQVESSFNSHVKTQMFFFGKRYRDLLDNDYFMMMDQYHNAYDRLEFLLKYVGFIGQKAYIMIDEYDNFTNTMLSLHGQEQYHAVTHGSGFFRYFFNLLKGGTSDTGSGLGRLFITGVSPVTMDDVTSGFNIGQHISLESDMQSVLGLTRQDVHELLSSYRLSETTGMSESELFNLLQEWGDHYLFSKDASEPLFNTDIVLYLLNNLINKGRFPEDMIDQNIKVDYGKLRHLVVLDKQLNGNFQQLAKIIEQEEVQALVNKSLPVEGLIKSQNFISLLFYFGLLSYAREQDKQELLKIPNRTVKNLLYGYLRESYEDANIFRIDVWRLTNLIRNMAYKGEWEAVFRFLANEIERQTRVRDYLTGEKVIQTFLLAYLNVADYYTTRSEEEMGKGYADLYLEPFFVKYPEIEYAYLIEIKYLTRKEWSEKRQEEERSEASRQLRQYSQDDRIKKRRKTSVLKCLTLIFRGWELTLAEELKS